MQLIYYHLQIHLYVNKYKLFYLLYICLVLYNKRSESFETALDFELIPKFHFSFYKDIFNWAFFHLMFLLSNKDYYYHLKLTYEIQEFENLFLKLFIIFSLVYFPKNYLNQYCKDFWNYFKNKKIKGLWYFINFIFQAFPSCFKK